MSPRILIVAAALTLAAAPVAAQSDPNGPLAAVERMFEGMRTADSGLVRAQFADGARFSSVDTRATPATIRFDPVDGWIRAIAGSSKRWNEQIYDVEVKVDGDMAFVWAPYTFYLDGAARHCGINAINLQRAGDTWKVTQVSDTRRRENCPDPLARK